MKQRGVPCDLSGEKNALTTLCRWHSVINIFPEKRRSLLRIYPRHPLGGRLFSMSMMIREAYSWRGGHKSDAVSHLLDWLYNAIRKDGGTIKCSSSSMPTQEETVVLAGCLLHREFVALRTVFHIILSTKFYVAIT